MRVYVQRQVVYLAVVCGLLGVILFGFGAVVALPHNRLEEFSNPPYKTPGIWANETIRLRQDELRPYSLDLINENNTLIYVEVREATNPFVFRIEGDYGFNYSGPVTYLPIDRIKPIEAPFAYFWTPPDRGSWDFVFDNPYDTDVNITLKIIDYRYNANWIEEVTYYRPLLDRPFAYAGMILLIASLLPPCYYLYKNRKRIDRKPWWQDTKGEIAREAEEKAKLK